MNQTISSVVLIALISVTATHAYLYNITVVFKEGGTDQPGNNQLTLLMQGKPPQRRIVNLGGRVPLPAGMVMHVGSDVDFIPAHEVSGLHFCWFQMDHGDSWNGTILLEKVIVDPEYLKDKPQDRLKLRQAFCPDPKDVPLRSWNYIILRHCQV